MEQFCLDSNQLWILKSVHFANVRRFSQDNDQFVHRIFSVALFMFPFSNWIKSGLSNDVYPQIDYINAKLSYMQEIK